MKNIVVIAAIATALGAAQSVAVAAEKPAASAEKVLTVEEGRELYALGVAEGAARAGLAGPQAAAKGAVDKINAAATPEPHATPAKKDK